MALGPGPELARSSGTTWSRAGHRAAVGDGGGRGRAGPSLGLQVRGGGVEQGGGFCGGGELPVAGGALRTPPSPVCIPWSHWGVLWGHGRGPTLSGPPSELSLPRTPFCCPSLLLPWRGCLPDGPGLGGSSWFHPSGLACSCPRGSPMGPHTHTPTPLLQPDASCQLERGRTGQDLRARKPGRNALRPWVWRCPASHGPGQAAQSRASPPSLEAPPPALGQEHSRLAPRLACPLALRRESCDVRSV